MFAIIYAVGFLAMSTSSSAQEWTFDQGENVGCLTVKGIVHDQEPILFVYHDPEDHSWQFLSGGAPSEDEAMLVSMGTIVNIDPSVLEVGHISPGQSAHRKSVESPWELTGTN